MFEIDYKSIKKGHGLFYVFFIIGIVLTILFTILFISAIIKKNSLNREVKADYIIPNEHYDDDGDLMYSPIYYYTVNGKQYSCSSNYSSSKTPSEHGVVYYEKGNPSNCLSDYSSSYHLFMLIGVGMGLLFGCVGGFFVIKQRKCMKRAKYLAIHGKLIKNIPYTMKPTNTYLNGREIKKIAIDYTPPNGLTIHLTGNSRFDGKDYDEDGLVDLLIDPNDPNNYFIDFNIGYSGNVQVEYYNNSDEIPEPDNEPTVEQNNNPTVEQSIEQQEPVEDTNTVQQSETHVSDELPTLGPVINTSNDFNSLPNDNNQQ
jgi:hypothetical protein